MATFNLTWFIANTVGQTDTKIKYRIKGTTIWTTFLVPAPGDTASFQADNNRIYDVQYQNINNSDNPLSIIQNDIGFSDPSPTLFPTNTTVGYSFENLSEDIDQYRVEIALFTDPGTILETQIKAPAEPVTGEFTGLDPLTAYYFYITPAADQFSQTFTYDFTTDSVSTCSRPQNVIATLS